MDRENQKRGLKEFWHWLWHSESWLSYVVFLIIVFILIKFILLPGLGLIFGTKLPLAIVESCSMYHEGNLFSNQDKWFGFWQEKYSKFNITQEDFSTYKMKKGFNKGDLLVIRGVDPDKLRVGDIIIFNSGYRSTPIIHRIVEITETNGQRTFATMGDHNPGQIPYEKEISEEQIIGKAVFKLAPYLGWIKLIFYEPSRTPSERGFCKNNY